jgi:hypothetical protein
MKQLPILFSAPMVRAILNGSKTQTRRIVKLPARKNIEPRWDNAWIDGGFPDTGQYLHVEFRHKDDEWEGRMDRVYCPYGQPGDRLWVRETFMPMPHVNAKAFYRATDPLVGGKWKPSIFMPRNLSRITLEITAVRVQRLQDITEEDAIAEGMNQATADAVMCPEELATFAAAHILAPHAMARITFETVWAKINGPASWDANPFVWVITFNPITP